MTSKNASKTGSAAGIVVKHQKGTTLKVMPAPNVYGKPFCVLSHQTGNLLTTPRTLPCLLYFVKNTCKLFLRSFIGVLPPGCVTLCYTLDTQQFLRPLGKQTTQKKGKKFVTHSLGMLFMTHKKHVHKPKHNYCTRVVFFLLGDFPASEFSVPTLRNTLFHFHR